MPKNSTGQSATDAERLACSIVSDVLGVGAEVTFHDDQSRNAMVDALVRYSDGRVAVLEHSSLGPTAEANLERNVNSPERRNIVVEGLAGCWWAYLPRDLGPKYLDSLTRSVLELERSGVSDSDDLTERDHSALNLPAGVSVHRVDCDRDHPPTLHRRLDGVVGARGDDPNALVEELQQVLFTDPVTRKLDKLRAHCAAHPEAGEQHLFLDVRMSGLSPGWLFVLTDKDEPLPCTVPQLPEGLTQVWLRNSGTYSMVVRAIDGVGWRRDFPDVSRLSP